MECYNYILHHDSLSALKVIALIVVCRAPCKWKRPLVAADVKHLKIKT